LSARWAGGAEGAAAAVAGFSSGLTG